MSVKKHRYDFKLIFNMIKKQDSITSEFHCTIVMLTKKYKNIIYIIVNKS